MSAVAVVQQALPTGARATVRTRGHHPERHHRPPGLKIKTETCVCVCVYVWVDVLYFCEQFCFQLVSVNRSVAAEWHAVAVRCVVLLVPPNGQIVFRIDYRFATNCRFTFCIFCLCMYILFLLFV